jgi:hypothetical protein
VMSRSTIPLLEQTDRQARSKLRSAISMNWRSRPLERHEVIVELLGATTTHTALRVRAELDRGRSPLGVKVGDRSWRRCRCGGANSRGSGTTPFIRQRKYHRRQDNRAGTP